MALQSDRLGMVALSVSGDKPPNALQPILADGIHLRWASSREVGFPWGGYYLFRREHINENFPPACLRKDLASSQTSPGLTASFVPPEPTNPFVFGGGELFSEVNLRLISPSLDGETEGFDLTTSNGIWFSANPGEYIWRAQAVFHFQESGEVEIRAYFGKRLIGQRRVRGEAGERSSTSIEFSAITRIHISAGPASLFELCVDPVSPGAIQNWEPVAWAPAPFALPVTDLEYPCAPDAENLWHSRFTARERVRYGRGMDAIPDPTPLWDLGTLVLKKNSSVVLGNGTAWDQKLTGASLQVAGESSAYIIAAVLSPEKLVLNRRYRGASNPAASYTISQDTFSQLHDALMLLVNGGPAAGPMVSRLLPESIDEQGTLTVNHQSLLIQAPILAPQRALDLVNLTSLQPAIAEVLGLAWNDDTVDPDVFYDYLIVASPFAKVMSAKEILSRIQDQHFSELDGFIVFNVGLRTAAVPLAPPDEVQVFALPGATHIDSDQKLVDSSNNAGLRWSVSTPESALASGAPMLSLVWRADFGETAPELSSEMPEYRLLTPRPLLVSTVEGNLKLTAPSSSDWPPLPMLKVDSSLPDGWYSYQVSSIDIFGRHSKNSLPAQWRQWPPPPRPRPWYFNPAAADDVVHPFAIQLLDKIPPPPPTAIEAFALDPRDPAAVRDAAYQRWIETLPMEARDSLVGLRVRWRWTPSQEQQAPDLREFRLYLEPGPMNARMGRIRHVTGSGPGESWVETDIEHTESDQAFVGAWLRVGGQAFLVLGSKEASPLSIAVRHIGPDRETAPRVGGCALVVPPLFSLGTVFVEHGSMQVIGTGTRWHAGLTGMKLKVSNEIDLYTISGVADVEHLTLSERYKGAPAIGKAFSVSHPLFVDYSNPIRWQERIFVVPAEEENWTRAEDEPGVRQYEVFLPGPKADDLRSLLGTPSIADPIIYAHVGITAADNRSHTPDDPHWDSQTWGRRFGNESQLGARVTVFRVLREQPADPVPPPDSDRVYASPTDYHGRSFYTYRWRPVDGLRAHIFRASDDTLFKTDWLMRTTRGALSPANDLHREIFSGMSDWTNERRAAAALALNGLRAPPDYGSLSPDAQLLLARLPGNNTAVSFAGIQERDWSIRASRQDATFVASFPPDWDELRWRSAAAALGRIRTFDDYAILGNDALRILAGLPGNERAFSQITSAALDPEEPDPADPVQHRWRNRLGPDNPDDFLIDPSLCAYVDTLNGRSTARYFYRSAHVDGAHNRSELSLSGPPVWLKDVVAPRTPRFTSVLAGPEERQITLSWAISSEPGLAEYRIYRTDTEDATRDLRLMTQVHTVRVPASLSTDPGELSWTDSDVPALQRHWYRMVAVDTSGNVSDPSETLAMQAYDDTLPTVPPLSISWTEDTPPVARASWTSTDESRLERRKIPFGPWFPVSEWMPAGTHIVEDESETHLSREYHLRVRKQTGAQSVGRAIPL